MCEDGFLTSYYTKFHLYSINGFEPTNIYFEIERGTDKYSIMTHVYVNSDCLDQGYSQTKYVRRVSWHPVQILDSTHSFAQLTGEELFVER